MNTRKLLLTALLASVPCWAQHVEYPPRGGTATTGVLTPRAVSTNTDTLSCSTTPAGDKGGVVDYSFAGTIAVTVPAAGGSCAIGTVIWLSNKNTAAANAITLSGGFSGTVLANASCRLRVDSSTVWSMMCGYKATQGNSGAALMAGTVTGTSIPLCTDSSGNATTANCLGTRTALFPVADTVSQALCSAAPCPFATTLSMPANLPSGTTVRILAFGVGTTTSTSSPKYNMQVKMTGGTTSGVATCTQQSSTTPIVSITNFPWWMDCTMMITAAPATNATILGNGFSVVANTSSSVISSGMALATAAVVDTTATQTISLIAATTMVSGQAFTLQQLIMDVR